MANDCNCVPELSKKVRKVWELNDTYQLVCIGRIRGHNLTVDIFNTVSGNEQLDNFVTLFIYVKINLRLTVRKVLS